MYQIISKVTKKMQIVSDEVWARVVKSGMDNRYKITHFPAKVLKDVPTEILKEIKKPITKKKTK